MHIPWLSIGVIVSCYLHLFAKAIHDISSRDSIMKVPLNLENIFKGVSSRVNKRLENNSIKDAKSAMHREDSQIDLRGLYSTLKNHPELMDRRLKIGGKTPPPMPNKTYMSSFSKRTPFNIGVAQPACPFRIEWVRLTHARDINNTEVEVFQPTDDNSNRYQWFYTVTCDYDSLLSEDADCPLCCRAVNHRRYSSQCVPRKSYVMALIIQPNARDSDWGYIQVDSSCNCAVTTRQ